MASSELNKLSKRQILESLYYEQSQSTATLSRFFTAIARQQGISPEDLAKAFAADEENHQYVEKFNAALKEMRTKNVAEEPKAEETSEENANQ